MLPIRILRQSSLFQIICISTYRLIQEFSKYQTKNVAWKVDERFNSWALMILKNLEIPHCPSLFGHPLAHQAVFSHSLSFSHSCKCNASVYFSFKKIYWTKKTKRWSKIIFFFKKKKGKVFIVTFAIIHLLNWQHPSDFVYLSIHGLHVSLPTWNSCQVFLLSCYRNFVGPRIDIWSFSSSEGLYSVKIGFTSWLWMARKETNRNFLANCCF